VSDGAVASGRRSLWYYTGEVRDPALRRVTLLDPDAESLFGRMLREDANSLLPYGIGRDEGFTAAVNGSDATRVTPLITGTLPSEYGDPPLLRKLRDFFGTTADLILAYGTAHYELTYLYQNPAEPAGTPSTFRLEPIPPGTVHNRRHRLVQYVPPDAARQHTRKGVGFIDLDPAAIIEFRLASPRARQIRHAMRVLAVASAQTPAQSRLVERSMGGQLPYDFTDHQRQISRIVARATAPLGWTGRGLFDGDQLEPYLVWRHLQFLAFKIHPRETILTRLNATITTAGRRLGFTANIELSGVPTLDNVREREDDLAHGRQSLSDLVRWAIQ
jgi:hypothetical protein